MIFYKRSIGGKMRKGNVSAKPISNVGMSAGRFWLPVLLMIKQGRFSKTSILISMTRVQKH